MKIQIVEDDDALSAGIVLALKASDKEFCQCGDMKCARKEFESRPFDIIILDINLPDGSGYEYLKWVRERSDLPVLMLTANDLEIDEVRGLSLGADDYMTKPFSLAILRARIEALCRRKRNGVKRVYEREGLLFDFDRLLFYKDGRELVLSRNEQKLLMLFVENEGHILKRDVLVDRLWTDGAEYVDENALSVTVNRLRKKLEDDGESGFGISTIYGQGYIWKQKQPNSNC